jgi:ethanolamine utilization protein EutM
MASEALGLLEVKGLVALMEGTDAMLKSANVEIIGWDKAGSGMVTVFVKGDVAAVKAAIDSGAEAAGRVGSVVAVHVIARPHDELPGMYPKTKKAAPIVTTGAAPAPKK